MKELNKEQELEIARKMEERSIEILLYLLSHKKIQPYLKDIIDNIEKGSYDISHTSATRFRLGKDRFIQKMRLLCKSPTAKKLRDVRMNYIIAFRMGSRLIEEEPGEHPELESLISKYLHHRDSLIEANMGVISYVANYMEKQRVPWQTSYEEHDVRMEAYTAMIQAAGRYDYRVGCRFFSYATWTVYNAVYNFIREEASAIHYPVSHHKRRTTIVSNISTLEQKTGRKISLGELEEELNLEPGSLEGNENTSFLLRVILDVNGDDPNQEFWESLADPSEYDKNFLRTLRLIILLRAKGLLTEEEIQLMCHDFELHSEMTEKDIKERFKIPSIKKLRESMREKIRKA